jgi:hypothetical protein
MLAIDIRIERTQRLLKMMERDAPLLAVRVAPLTREYQASAMSYAERLRQCAQAELDNLLRERADGIFTAPPAAAD